MKTVTLSVIIVLILISLLGCLDATLPVVTEPEPDKPVIPVNPDPVKNEPKVNVPFILDLTTIPAGTPEDYGFTGETDNITIDGDGNIVTQTPLGEWSTVTLPLIGDFDRNKDGGVVVEWEIKFPYWDGERWQEKNKLYLTLEDDADDGVYEVLYKPNSYSEELLNENLILTGFIEGESSILSEVRTWFPPTTGPDAVWIALKLVLYPTTAAGGNGNVELYFDDTGNGFASPYISVADESGSVFSQMSLTHRNETNPNYQILMRNISIRTVE